MVATGQAATLAAQSKASNKKKSTNKKTTTTPKEDVSNNPPVNTSTTGSKTSLSGIPVGTAIKTGATTPQYQTGSGVSQRAVFNTIRYTTDSPYIAVATLSNADKANLLIQLAAVPGLYGKGQAPTESFIRAQGNTVSFRSEDYTALGKIMAHADTTGAADYKESLITFVQNPGLANQFFGKVSASGTAVSSKFDLMSEFNAKTMDLFDTPVDKKIVDAYVRDVNKAELRAGGGIGAQQKEDIFLKYVEQTAMQRYAQAIKTPDKADDIALEKGSLGSVIKKIRNAYTDNGIAVSDKQIYGQALKGIRSEQALQNALNNISTQAITQFPAFKEQILAGNSVKDLLGPYIEKYQTIYGKAPKVADLTDVASGTTPIPVDAWEKMQWKKPEIKETKFYKDTIKGDLRTMATAFGVNV